MNEYEVLQLLMGDCRERLAEYQLNLEEEIKMSQVKCHEFLLHVKASWRDVHHHHCRFQQMLTLSSSILQRQDLDIKERLAIKLRLSEKRIISATMDAVRSRLAPIRGIPTKSGGMQDVNSDLKEIFDTIESIPTAPLKLLDTFVSWAKGEQDPDWGKATKDKPKRPW